ncbi:Sulfotransferase domain-containing protein [Catalinimonas alkaloidigena]|uniref:Sulfotransferase domain-containing protein n=1 Tax=Catalinimonas alkaloidigena TaxID=1075417 RepID=A0A1G9LE80_9BACT|nr:sulfotransferase [Catalinimonas alkaloidigena]SDL60251.1 Sulfotransferase domain-containing protein [Catalinimonas alkaloidigena]
MGVVDFLIIGAPKSGTTSLYNYLKQHPGVFLPELKEPKYFALKDVDLTSLTGNPVAIDQIRHSTVTTWTDYQSLFEGAQAQQLRGEASPIYFHNAQAPTNIKALVPEVKLIVILRDPVSAVYSDWLHNINEGFEDIYDLHKALTAWSSYRETNKYIPYLDYLTKRYYGRHLQRYYTLFPKEQVLVLFYEDLLQDASLVMNQVTDFLGLSQHNLSYTQVHMKGRGKPVFTTLHRWGKMLHHQSSSVVNNRYTRRLVVEIDKINRKKALLSREERMYLESLFQDDIRLLEELTQRNLTHWRSGNERR